MADFVTLAPLLEESRDIVIDALRRDHDRRAKLAVRASSDADTDPNAIVLLLNQSSRLDLIVRALNAQPLAADTPVVPSPAPAPATTQAQRSPALPVTPPQPDGGVENVMSRLLAERAAPVAAAPTPPPVPEPDPDVPTKAWVLAPDAIAALIGSDNDPLPEDNASPSAQNSPFHGDQFDDDFGPSAAG